MVHRALHTLQRRRAPGNRPRRHSARHSWCTNLCEPSQLQGAMSWSSSASSRQKRHWGILVVLSPVQAWLRPLNCGALLSRCGSPWHSCGSPWHLWLALLWPGTLRRARRSPHRQPARPRLLNCLGTLLSQSGAGMTRGQPANALCAAGGRGAEPGSASVATPQIGTGRRL